MKEFSTTHTQTTRWLSLGVTALVLNVSIAPANRLRHLEACDLLRYLASRGALGAFNNVHFALQEEREFRVTSHSVYAERREQDDRAVLANNTLRPFRLDQDLQFCSSPTGNWFHANEARLRTTSLRLVWVDCLLDRSIRQMPSSRVIVTLPTICETH